MKEIRFIHTADLHLDSPFSGLGHLPEPLHARLRESTFSAFEKVIDAAIEREVDFVLISGDLFDGENRSIKAQARLRRQLERLGEKGIFAFAVHGNHDHLGGDWITLEMPDHVHIFPENTEAFKWAGKDGITAYIYGFSYGERHVFSKKIGEYKKAGAADFHIAMLHGCEETLGGAHAPYAPFSIHDLLQKEMDYWALGHIHKKQILHENPHIVYPGNIQGRHRKEGGEKGCYAVTLDSSGKTVLEFIETADIRWESAGINVQKGMDLTSLYTACMAEIASLASNGSQGILCEMTLENPHLLPENVLRSIENGEFLEMLQDGCAPDGPFVWPYRILAEQPPSSAFSADSQLFAALRDMVLELQEEGMEKAVSDLYSHVYGSRYLDVLAKEDQEKLLESAKALVMQTILRFQDKGAE
jgi:DNA repair exonuclease SbcCD nuclease subunit